MPIIRANIVNNKLNPNVIGLVKQEDLSNEILNSLDKHLTIEFLTAQSTWVYTHNLGKRPSVRCTDTLGRPLFGYITDNNINSITIQWKSAKAGFLILN